MKTSLHIITIILVLTSFSLVRMPEQKVALTPSVFAASPQVETMTHYTVGPLIVTIPNQIKSGELVPITFTRTTTSTTFSVCHVYIRTGWRLWEGNYQYGVSDLTHSKITQLEVLNLLYQQYYWELLPGGIESYPTTLTMVVTTKKGEIGKNKFIEIDWSCGKPGGPDQDKGEAQISLTTFL